MRHGRLLRLTAAAITGIAAAVLLTFVGLPLLASDAIKVWVLIGVIYLMMAARTIVRFVRECRDRGKTVIYSTHVMSEVEKLCDLIGIIHHGRLVAEGTLEQLRTRFGDPDLEEIFVRAVGGEEEAA